MFAHGRLLRLADAMPFQVAEFLHAFVLQQDRQLWIFEMKDLVRPLLEKILDAGGTAEAEGVAVVNALGERGTADHSDLVLKRRDSKK